MRNSTWRNSKFRVMKVINCVLGHDRTWEWNVWETTSAWANNTWEQQQKVYQLPGIKLCLPASEAEEVNVIASKLTLPSPQINTIYCPRIWPKYLVVMSGWPDENEPFYYFFKLSSILLTYERWILPFSASCTSNQCFRNISLDEKLLVMRETRLHF